MIIEFERIVEIVSEIKKSKEEEGGIKQVYFIACGGSLGAFTVQIISSRQRQKTSSLT